MEIKTCEQYVLAKLEETEKKLEDAYSMIEALEQVEEKYKYLIDVLGQLAKVDIITTGSLKDRHLISFASIWDDDESYDIFASFISEKEN